MPTMSTDLHPRLPQDRLIVALDFPNALQTLEFTERLEQTCRWVKVGLELFVAEGPGIVASLAAQGFSVFLDLKLHDIPNTVAGAVRTASAAGARLLTVHASGGPAMLSAAAEAAAGVAAAPQLLAVTVLTSMDLGQLQAVGVNDTPAVQVARLAKTAWDSGIRGLVCSAEEVTATRGAHPEMTLVVPGIRPAGAAAGDQKRVATPASAMAAGADYLVVGRPITQSADPAAAAQKILEEIASVEM
ncbi:orotidine 5'-phosphate decarboxylase [Acidobacterium capsulatum ATCC 51196]|uniref:Orotidine 5'-phosphate decarboxylase n=2 Tax=Acidobacteriaceae TaxID=204434 RepID=C1F303_ACIC5|nr:orotidine 5'-phosphate decarboxylase [Acidobacterium capsulatum ATCC 51196]